MDLLTRADLELLAQRGGPEPYLSLVHTDRAAVVRLGDDEAFGHCELLDRVAVGTLSGRGHVYAVPAAEVPGRGGGVAAIFRDREAPQPRVPEWRRHAEERDLGD